jgi:hypothetical protein
MWREKANEEFRQETQQERVKCVCEHFQGGAQTRGNPDASFVSERLLQRRQLQKGLKADAAWLFSG